MYYLLQPEIKILPKKKQTEQDTSLQTLSYSYIKMCINMNKSFYFTFVSIRIFSQKKKQETIFLTLQNGSNIMTLMPDIICGKGNI